MHVAKVLAIRFPVSFNGLGGHFSCLDSHIYRDDHSTLLQIKPCAFLFDILGVMLFLLKIILLNVAGMDV
jgi:hypothetical protein